MSIYAPKMALRISLPKTVFIGALILVVGGASMAALNYFFHPTLYSFMLPMFVCTLGIGTIRPTASGGAMSEAPKKVAGSAAALFNFTSFAGGAISTAIASVWARTPYKLGIFIFILGVFAVYFSAKNTKTP
jgi:DHA1 family bicyclomycin/chloramphenicol resistance-like MFS transporter